MTTLTMAVGHAVAWTVAGLALGFAAWIVMAGGG